MSSDTPARPEKAIARVRKRMAISQIGRFRRIVVLRSADVDALLAYADALAQENAELAMWLREAEVGARETQTQHDLQLAALRERLARAEAVLNDVASSGVEFDDPRIGYVVVQVDRPTWDELAARRPDPTKGTPDPTPARLPGDAHG